MFWLALAGLGLQIGGLFANASRAREQNRRQRQTLEQDIEYLQNWYDAQEDIYEANRHRAEDTVEQAREHVTESATARMEDLRQDRDITVWNTQERTTMAAQDVLGVAMGAEMQAGSAEAAGGFSGLERSGTLERGLDQTADFGQMGVEQAEGQLDLQRDLGFQQAYGFERGARRTGEELGRQIENIDLQYQQSLEQMGEQWDLLGSQYQHDLRQGQDQLRWLNADRGNIGVDLAFGVLGAGLEFGSFAFEYDIFQTPGPSQQASMTNINSGYIPGFTS